MNRSIVRKRDFFQGLPRSATAHWLSKNWRNISENDSHVPMIKSKGLKLQTTNISSGLSTRLFVFRMPSNFKVYLTKAGHYRQFDCSLLAAKHYQIS